MELKDNVAIITGGASGLGAATARELHAHGAKIAIFDRQVDKGEEIAKELGGIFCEVDVTKEETIVAGFARAREALSQERILINCAGTGAAMKTQSKGRTHPLDVFNMIIQINLVGTFACCTNSAAGMAGLEVLDEDGLRGVIINTASVAAFDGQVGQVSYSASKGGVTGMTLPMARDLAEIGVRVCTIAPGIFETPLMAGATGPVLEGLLRSANFPKRLGKPEEFGSLARQICENDMLNGEVIRLDGGIRMPPR